VGSWDDGGADEGQQKGRTDIPALGDKDAQEEDDQADAGADPAVEDVGGGFVEEGLVLLAREEVLAHVCMSARLAHCLLLVAQ
jgi:hypothetical protein